MSKTQKTKQFPINYTDRNKLVMPPSLDYGTVVPLYTIVATTGE